MANEFVNAKEVYLNRQEQTFYIEESLTPIPYKSEEGPNREPERLHDPRFSRFEFGIINRDGKRATYFIRSSELSDVMFRTRIAYEKELELEMNSSSARPAETLRFVAGNLKGMTPMEVIAEKGKDVLASQRDYLAKQTKYQKKNAPLIAACDQAIQLFESGKAAESSALKPLVIFRMDYPFANPYKRDDANRAQTRQMNITWNFGMEKPVDVHIMECYAPTQKNGTTLETPIMQNAVNKTDNHFNLSAAEWIEAVHCLDRVKALFEQQIWAEHRKAAIQLDKDNREKMSSANHNDKNDAPIVPEPKQEAYPSTRKITCKILKKGRNQESGLYCAEAEYRIKDGDPRKLKLLFVEDFKKDTFTSIKTGEDIEAEVFVKENKCYCVAIA